MYTKALESFNFKLINKYDINDILKIIDSFDVEWRLDTSRQNQEYTAHTKTNTYYIKSIAPNWNKGKDLKVFPLANNIKLLSLVNDICKDLEKVHDGICSIAMVVKLLPESEIRPHVDDTEYLQLTRRHHIAIKTNDKVLFCVDKECINMKPGECWEINNSKEHFVKNDSNEERIHLIIDIMPNKFLGDKK